MTSAPYAEVGAMVLFAVVVQHQSISGAARELGLAKSGVSKRIRVLEESLGVRLLNRNTRGLRLTDAGVRYYEHCASVLASAEAAQHSIQGTEAGDRGLIRISSAARFAHLHLVPIVAGFTREPNAWVSVMSDPLRALDTAGRLRPRATCSRPDPSRPRP